MNVAHAAFSAVLGIGVLGLVYMAQDCFRARDFASGAIISVIAGLVLFSACASLAVGR